MFVAGSEAADANAESADTEGGCCLDWISGREVVVWLSFRWPLPTDRIGASSPETARGGLVVAAPLFSCEGANAGRSCTCEDARRAGSMSEALKPRDAIAEAVVEAGGRLSEPPKQF